MPDQHSRFRSLGQERTRIASKDRPRQSPARIEMLTSDPRPSGVRKLTGAVDLWRLSVGDYRIVYSINDEQRVIDIGAVRHRKDAYR